MKIYAVTGGENSIYEVIALTVNKERAEHLAKIYQGDVDEYEDAQELPENPIWIYGMISLRCWLLDPYQSLLYDEKIDGDVVYVRAEDEAHARKKAQDMIAKYKAEQEGIT